MNDKVMGNRLRDVVEIMKDGQTIGKEIPRFCEQCEQPYTTTIYRVRSTESYDTVCPDCHRRNGTCTKCGEELIECYLFGESRMICRNHPTCEVAVNQRIESQSRAIAYRESIITDVLPGIRFYGDTVPERLPNATDVRRAYKRAYKLLYENRGVILFGPTGTAKTRTMYLVLRTMFVYHGRGVKVFEGGEFGNAAAVAFGPDGEGERFVDRVAGYDILAFDDFGKGVLTERGISTLFAIVEKRMQDNRPIVITTNDNLSTLRQRVRGEATDTTLTPLFRRLGESCETIEIRNERGEPITL